MVYRRKKKTFDNEGSGNVASKSKRSKTEVEGIEAKGEGLPKSAVPGQISSAYSQNQHMAAGSPLGGWDGKY